MLSRVLVFSEGRVTDEGGRALENCRKRVRGLLGTVQLPYDRVRAVLIYVGVVEAAVADALCPDRDRRLPLLCAFRAVMDALGRALVARPRDAAIKYVEDASRVLEGVPGNAMPSNLALGTPEGFAFYTLYPEAYAAAAVEWSGRARPSRVLCLGLRGIGTTLASVVRGALEQAGVPASTWTVRPRGHPFDRIVKLDPELVSAWNLDDTTFLLIDEGPGLSGSSLMGTAAALTQLGVPDDRIVVLAAFNPDVERLRSSTARARWPRHRVLTAGFERVRQALADDDAIPGEGEDISGGAWRAYFNLPQPWPAAYPIYERMKFVAGHKEIVRFAGLGDEGERMRARGERLAAAGWTPAPAGLRQGFLRLPYVAGTIVSTVDQDWLGRAVDFVAWLRNEESETSVADVEPIAEMLRVNAREGLGDSVQPVVDRLVAIAGQFSEPVTAIDGRLMPHEWVRTPSGFVKVDALDHHRGHFLPGCTDAAWDLAGLIVEADVPAPDRDALFLRYLRKTGDRTMAARFPFYRAAYAAFGLGYATLASESLTGAEQRRFQAERNRYAGVLSQALGTATISAPSAP
jgi:hypothetical protein